MKSIFSPVLIILVSITALSAQQSPPTLDYYLPKVQYDPAIPTPASWLGYEIGEWHATHDQLVGYMRALDAASDRISLQEYGRSFENRPMLCLTITDPSNFSRLNEIKATRKQLGDPSTSNKVDVKNMPAVYYMGYSIHGNETSGSNAALAVAYYLAAAQTQEVGELLKNTIILFDPCFNPDGMQRFSAWINSHKSQNVSTDPAGDEYNEPWPRGRTNHYGFDLNRDWLVVQQPESAGRVAIFQDWKPNVLTDHHEMGSNSTFFFQPGVPSRVNPITPARNQELTAKIATYHADLLSRNKVLFYTGENYDDFYYGKGSTYPDAQGCIGILFEQGSSRGTAQETENGVLTFPYSIRNHVFASLSSLKAVKEMRVELNEYMRDFYRSAVEEAAKSDIKGYVFSGADTPLREFLVMLSRHSISLKGLKEKLSADGKTFEPGSAYFVPCDQAQYRLIRAIFERTTTFRDSIFYDISTWTLPDAFGLNWAAVRSRDFKPASIDKDGAVFLPPALFQFSGDPSYAYAIPPESYEIPGVLAKALQAGLRVRVAMEPFSADGRSYRQGTLLLAADRQGASPEKFMRVLNDIAASGVFIDVIENGLTLEGPDLGSSAFAVLRQPKILMLTGEGVSVSDAGEIWHLLDTRYNMPLTLAETGRVAGMSLSKYNVLIMPDGAYGRLPADKVKQFVQDGGTLIASGSALKWLKSSSVVPVEFRQSAEAQQTQRPYGSLEQDRGALAMAGAIFEADLDLTHPLCFGYTNPKLPVFLGDTLFVAPGKNPYATPVRLSAQPLLSGYVHARHKVLAPGAAAAVVYGLGRGKVICFPGDMNFRAFWYGTNRLFANAIFFGNLINADSAEKKE